MSAPTIPQQHEYDGTRCPQCGESHTIEGDEFTAGDQQCWQSVHCTLCGASWDDLYKLVGFDNLKDEEGEETELPAPTPAKGKYTVILLYPAGTTESYGQDTWMGAAQGSTPEEAIADARRQCNEDNYGPKEEAEGAWDSDDDLYCIACMPGEHDDVKP